MSSKTSEEMSFINIIDHSLKKICYERNNLLASHIDKQSFLFVGDIHISSNIKKYIDQKLKNKLNIREFKTHSNIATITSLYNKLYLI